MQNKQIAAWLYYVDNTVSKSSGIKICHSFSIAPLPPPFPQPPTLTTLLYAADLNYEELKCSFQQQTAWKH